MASNAGTQIATSLNGGDSALLRDVSKIPQPDEPLPGKILDEHGDTIPTTQEGGILTRTNSKLAEQVTLSKGTLVLITSGPALIMLILALGAILISYGTKSAGTEGNIQLLNQKFDTYLTQRTEADARTQRDIDKMQQGIDKMNTGYQQLEVIKARMDSFEAGFKARGKE